MGTGSATFACNGQTGFTDTLPVGKTEKGNWAADAGEGGALFVPAPISFNIPLAGELEAANVHYSQEPGFATTCTGTFENPTAPSGQLCVYIGFAGFIAGEGGFLDKFFVISKANINQPGASPSGAFILFFAPETPDYITGSWAVTG